MEQGPVLEELGLPLVPVAAISGQTRLMVSIAGSQVLLHLCAALAASTMAFVEFDRKCAASSHKPFRSASSATTFLLTAQLWADSSASGR